MIPEVMVQKSIMKMKKRGDIRIGVSPLKHLMAGKALSSNSCL
jgi:hypothetical protein